MTVRTYTLERTLPELRLRFFDQDLVVRSDSPAYLDLFARMYPRFRVASSASSDRYTTECTVLTRDRSSREELVLVLDGEVWPLPAGSEADGLVYDLILNTIITKVRSHFLIHAGVVARANQGMILAADSHHGKTTLTLELVRRGYTFLSDELAAIGRSDGHVYPFPRTLRVRPSTLDLLGLSEYAEAADEWLGKLLLDADQLRPGCTGTAAPLRSIVILDAPDREERATEEELGLRVARTTEAFLADLRALEEVEGVTVDTSFRHPALTVTMKHRMQVLPDVERIARRHDVLILDVRKRPQHQPSFDGSVCLTSIPTSVAARELVRHFQAGHTSAILQEDHERRAAGLFVELATLIRDATCYRLTVGPLQEMADAVCDIGERTS